MKENNNILYIGIDIAKQDLVLAVDGQKKAHSFTNKPEGHEQVIAHVRRLSCECCVVVEATGGYEHALLEALLNAGIESALVLPQRVRSYAKSQGYLAKTDPLDAALIAEFGRVSQPRRFRLCDQVNQELKALMQRRSDLVAEHTRETNRMETASSRLRKFIEKHVLQLEEQIAEIERLSEELIAQTPEIQRKEQRLREIKGFGPVVSRTLLVWMPELGTISDGQAAALAGVAPYNRDSGPSSRRRSTQGGRARVRSMLYMSAVVASRHNPILSAFYRRLVLRGKPAKVALTAVMRKLVVLANHSLKYPDFQLA